MAATPAFRQAPAEYDRTAENLFRRELENILVIALAVADNIATGSAPVASYTHKRHQYLPSVGVVTHG